MVSKKGFMYVHFCESVVKMGPWLSIEAAKVALPFIILLFVNDMVCTEFNNDVGSRINER